MISVEPSESSDLPLGSSPKISLASARSVLAALYDGAVLMTLDLCVIDHNVSYAAMTGLRARRLKEQVDLGRSAFELIAETTGEDRRAVESCIREKKGVHLAEREVENIQGMRALAWLSFVPVLDDAGEVVAIMQILRDVSGDAQAQAKLKELLALMKARAEDLERAVARRTAELSAALEDVTRLSRTDPLTGLLNRRAFSEMAAQAIALAKRHDRCLAIMMCDLDHFKKVNDHHGHSIGDQVLQAVAETLGTNVRESDAVARFGGEEFVVMLTETSRDAVMEIAQRFNSALRKLPICSIIPDAERPQTISIGVALFPEHGADLDQLLIAADGAMYVAKQGGRDQAVLYDASLAAAIEATAEAPKRLLLIEGDQRRGEARARELGVSYDVVFAPSAAFALTLASHSQFDVVVCDERVQGVDGLEILRETLKALPGALRILMVETEDFYFAVRATNYARVDHFILRTEAGEKLAVAIEDGMARREVIRAQIVAERSLIRSIHIAGGRVVQSIVTDRSIDFAFQPIVSSETGDCFSYEALCRPQCMPRIGPAELFETAVRSGDIWRLGRLGRDILASRIPLLPEDIPLFVNLHPAEIEDPMLLEEQDPLRPYANRIVFEITERASILDFDDFRNRLNHLKSLGYRFAVDDLGAGYASLSSVALLEPDFLKIDMSITRDLRRDTPRYGLVRRIVEFANDHALQVVAEGIETTEQADAAREIGSHFLQGYLLGRPARIAMTP